MPLGSPSKENQLTFPSHFFFPSLLSRVFARNYFFSPQAEQSYLCPFHVLLEKPSYFVEDILQHTLSSSYLFSTFPFVFLFLFFIIKQVSNRGSCWFSFCELLVSSVQYLGHGDCTQKKTNDLFHNRFAHTHTQNAEVSQGKDFYLGNHNLKLKP